MDILEVLGLTEKPIENKDYVTDAVFYSTLYRLGREDHRDCPVEEREELLNYLEHIK